MSNMVIEIDKDLAEFITEMSENNGISKKQYVYEDLVELMFNCSDTFEWHAEKWEWTNE